MFYWFAFKVDYDGDACVGYVIAEDASAAYKRAIEECHCRVDYVSRLPPKQDALLSLQVMYA